MIAFIVCIGAMMVLMIVIGTVISRNGNFGFDEGVFFGILFSAMFFIEVALLGDLLKKPKPTAMDVYQGNTTLEYKMVDGEKTDSVVVFKKR